MRLLTFFSIAILLFACKSDTQRVPIQELNLELSKAIDIMANRDKQMQINTLKFINADQAQQDQVEKLKQQVFEKHAKEIDEILEKYGYPTEQLVGQVSTKNFFALLNHTNNFPEVKDKGIKALETAMNHGQADSSLFVTLKDQYATENHLPSVYGTIVQFNDKGQAFIKNNDDSIDNRRIAFGLDSLNNYLNLKTIQYFNLNRDALQSKGISKPTLY